MHYDSIGIILKFYFDYFCDFFPVENFTLM